MIFAVKKETVTVNVLDGAVFLFFVLQLQLTVSYIMYAGRLSLFVVHAWLDVCH